jgi:hypothetical protein
VSQGDHVKKLFIGLTLASLSLSAVAGTTATLLLKGTIAPQLNISVAPEATASALDLTTTQSSTKVATVQEKSNSSSGYKVTISSQNLGVLKNNTHSFVYVLAYNGSALNLASPITQTQNSSAAVTVNKNVNISYTGVPADQLVAGDYTDTITFTIAAN